MVKAELARTELELLDMLEENGISDFKSLHGDEEDLPDSQVLDVVTYVVGELDAEGKIYCKCEESDNGRQYDAEILDDGVKVTCRKCGASSLIPTDSNLGAHAFLNSDALYLE